MLQLTSFAADDQKVSEFQSGSYSDGRKGFPETPINDTVKSGNILTAEPGEEDDSSSNLIPSPKYTMSEKWIMDQQKKKLQDEQNWILKQQKTKQRIAACFHKLKVCVLT